MRKWIVLAFGLGLAPLAAAASELDEWMAKGSVQLMDADLVELASDHSWVGTTVQGSSFSQKLSADGSAVLIFKGKDDHGKWRVDGNKYCTAWTKLRKGKEACAVILKASDGSYAAFNDDGSLNSTFTVE